jgi:hypothetical protein
MARAVLRSHPEARSRHRRKMIVAEPEAEPYRCPARRRGNVRLASTFGRREEGEIRVYEYV